MASRTTTKQQKAGTALAAPAAAPQPLAVSLVPKHLKAAIAFRDKAVATVISDKKTDEGALVTIKEGKDLKRKIEADWDAVKRPLNGLLTQVRNLERAELEAVEAGLKPITDRHVAWKEADDARIEREARAEREKKEREATLKREQELQEQEDAAIRLEAQSPALSARELWFVTRVFEDDLDIGRGATSDLAKLEAVCKQAGYKDPAKAVERLVASEKIIAAIAVKREAAAVREQAAALREQPVVVTTTKPVAQTARVSGLRNTTSYKCEGIVDLDKFIAAYRAGELPDDAMVPNFVHLNKKAEDLKDKFEQAYPGARLKVTKGVAG